ncbi:MAG: hypothetical protein WCY19_03895 [Candidatus Gastranaerophilaceae bacterium]
MQVTRINGQNAVMNNRPKTQNRKADVSFGTITGDFATLVREEAPKLYKKYPDGCYEKIVEYLEKHPVNFRGFKATLVTDQVRHGLNCGFIADPRSFVAAVWPNPSVSKIDNFSEVMKVLAFSHSNNDRLDLPHAYKLFNLETILDSAEAFARKFDRVSDRLEKTKELLNQAKIQQELQGQIDKLNNVDIQTINSQIGLTLQDITEKASTEGKSLYPDAVLEEIQPLKEKIKPLEEKIQQLKAEKEKSKELEAGLKAYKYPFDDYEIAESIDKRDSTSNKNAEILSELFPEYIEEYPKNHGTIINIKSVSGHSGIY